MSTLPSIKPAPKRSTLLDVARACGLSKAAVSQALNWSAERSTLKAETRELILSKARELGYTASWTARSLSNQATKQVGLLFHYSMPETRGIYGDIVPALTATLESRGYHLLFVPLHGEGWRQTLRDNRFDACVVNDVDPSISLAATRAVGLPTVLLNNVSSDLGVSSVIPDDAAGTRLAVEHLIALGHRRIAYLRMGNGGIVPHFSVAVRRDAYAAAMRDAGLGEHVLAADEPMDQFLDRVPIGADGYTAIILYSHTEGVCILPLLHKRGIRCPQDVSLVCFNDTFPMSNLVPAFTTVSVPAQEIGRVGGELLLELLDPAGGRSSRQVVLPETLVVRESTAPPRLVSRDTLVRPDSDIDLT